jgi:hypothetical protein
MILATCNEPISLLYSPVICLKVWMFSCVVTPCGPVGR